MTLQLPRKNVPEILFTTDPGRRKLMTLPAHASTSIQRFRQLQRWVIDPSSKLEPIERAVGLLITHEGVITSQDLELAYKALSAAFEFQGSARIEWQADGNLDRRELSDFSRLNLPNIRFFPKYEFAIVQFLNATERAVFCPRGLRDYRFDSLLSDARANACLTLPVALSAHVMGTSKFTPLPRTCLARCESGMALKMSTREKTQTHKSDRAFERSLEAAYLGKKCDEIGDYSFCMAIRQALTSPQRGTIAARRAVISAQLLDLESKCEQVSVAANLLLAFCIDLHEEGTKGHGRLDVDSPRAYFNSIFSAFLEKFAGVDLMSLNSEKYTELIRAVALACPDSKGRAALVALHLFMHSWDFVPNIPNRVFGEANEARVKANRLWPLEIQCIRTWLEDAESTSLIESVRCAFAIGCSVPVRIGEILWQRLEGIRIEENSVELDISHLRSDPSLKSPESLRTLNIITDPRSVKTITRWVHRRRAEANAAPKLPGEPTGDLVRGYLFGDPNNPDKLYKLGATSLLLNRLLKAVTGDPSVGFHILRHTLASAFIKSTLCQTITIAESSDRNPIDAWGAIMGHASGQTGLVHYSHEYESALRMHLDADFSFHYLPNSKFVEFWTQITGSTYRKRLQRSAPEDRKLVWNRIFRSKALEQRFPKVHTGIELSLSCIPIIPPNSMPLPIRTVSNVLIDLSRGISRSSTQIRQDLSVSDVDKICIAVGCLSDRLTGRRTRQQSDLTMGIEALLESGGVKLGFKFKSRQLHQPRWSNLLDSMSLATDKTLLDEGVDYWLENVHGQYLALVPCVRLVSLLRILCNSQLNLQLMQIHVNNLHSNLSKEKRNELVRIETIFEGCLGQPVVCVYRKNHRGRPKFYLVITSKVQKKMDTAKQGAGQSISGLNCAFLAAYIASKVNGTPS